MDFWKQRRKLLFLCGFLISAAAAEASDKQDFLKAENFVAAAIKRLKSIAPEIPVKYPVNIGFRSLDGACGAVYFSGRIFLGNGDVNCTSPAENESIVIHEYMHAVQEATLGSQTNLSQSANEGFSDIMAALLTNNPHFGEGLWKDEPSWARNLESNYFVAGEETGTYSQSLLMSSAWWSLRQWYSNEFLIRILLESLVNTRDTRPVDASQVFHRSALYLIRVAATDPNDMCRVLEVFLKNKLLSRASSKEFLECAPVFPMVPRGREIVLDLPLESAIRTENSFEISFNLADVLALATGEKFVDPSQVRIEDVALKIDIANGYYENVGVVIQDVSSQTALYFRGSEETSFSRLPLPSGNAWNLKLKTPGRSLESVKKVSLRIWIKD